MNAITQVTKVAKVADVLRLMFELGVSKHEACKQLDIDVRTFDKWISFDREGAQAISELIATTNRQALAMILVNRLNYIGKIIEDAISPMTEPQHRVTLVKLLESMAPSLQADSRIDDASSDGVDELLTGPTLSPGKNRFSIRDGQTEISVEIQRNPVIDLNPLPEQP